MNRDVSMTNRPSAQLALVLSASTVPTPSSASAVDSGRSGSTQPTFEWSARTINSRLPQ